MVQTQTETHQKEGVKLPAGKGVEEEGINLSEVEFCAQPKGLGWAGL